MIPQAACSFTFTVLIIVLYLGGRCLLAFFALLGSSRGLAIQLVRLEL